MQICGSKDPQNQTQLWGHSECEPSESQRFHPEDYWGNFPSVNCNIVILNFHNSIYHSENSKRQKVQHLILRRNQSYDICYVMLWWMSEYFVFVSDDVPTTTLNWYYVPYDNQNYSNFREHNGIRAWGTLPANLSLVILIWPIGIAEMPTITWVSFMYLL